MKGQEPKSPHAKPAYGAPQKTGKRFNTEGAEVGARRTRRRQKQKWQETGRGFTRISADQKRQKQKAEKKAGMDRRKAKSPHAKPAYGAPAASKDEKEVEELKGRRVEG